MATLRPKRFSVKTSHYRSAEHAAKPCQDWKGSANLGYSVQRGDQKTGTISSSISVRERPEAPTFSAHWRTTYGLTMLFSKAEQNGLLVKSNTISSNARQDYLFTPRDFVLGLAQLDHIQAQGLYLRLDFLRPRGRWRHTRCCSGRLLLRGQDVDNRPARL